MCAQKLRLYFQLMRLDKPVGIFLLLWPTLMALWIAGTGQPDPVMVGIFILGVIVMRSAGCVINDWADKGLDAGVLRTKNRPLAAGLLLPREALGLGGVLAGIALFLVLQLNVLTIALSVVALLFVLLYPFMKRYTHLPQVILGMAFGWAVPMAFTALNSPLVSEALLLYVATICWTVAYDTEYAMADRVDDIRVGIKSTAILFGRADKAIIAALQILSLIFLTKLGFDLNLGKFYYMGLFCTIFFILYQQYLIKDRDPKQCLKAFLNNRIAGGVLFIGLALDYAR